VSAPAPGPWHGTVYRHLPVGSPYGPLDTRFAARSRENRWNLAGEPTFVLAGDQELLVQEFRQHIARDRDAALVPHYVPRQVFAVELRLRRVFDLTDRATIEALGIRDAPECFGERAVARATAGFMRHARDADGLLAPSLIAPDDPARWNLIILLDRLTEPLEAAVRRVTAVQTFQPDPAGNLPQKN
jgi:RES domain-containing protein